MENQSLETFGINIGALKSVFSKCFKPDNKFQTNVLNQIINFKQKYY